MKQIFSALLVLATSGCVTAKLAPAPDRTKTYELEHSLKKDQAYDKARQWVATDFKNAKEVIQYDDKSVGKTIIKANTSCPTLKMNQGWAQEHTLWFTLAIQSKNKKTTVTVNDIYGTALGAADDMQKPSSKIEADAVFKDCVDPMAQSIASSLK